MCAFCRSVLRGVCTIHNMLLGFGWENTSAMGKCALLFYVSTIRVHRKWTTYRHESKLFDLSAVCVVFQYQDLKSRDSTKKEIYTGTRISFRYAHESQKAKVTTFLRTISGTPDSLRLRRSEYLFWNSLVEINRNSLDATLYRGPWTQDYGSSGNFKQAHPFQYLCSSLRSRNINTARIRAFAIGKHIHSSSIQLNVLCFVVYVLLKPCAWVFASVVRIYCWIQVCSCR